MKRRFVINLSLFLLLAFATVLPPGSARSENPAVPPVLETWIPWVLYGHEEQRCPFLYGDDQSKECRWASQLNLDLHQQGGAFSQKFEVYVAGNVVLPGDDKIWPQDVQVDGVAAAVLSEDGRPVLRLEAGRHVVSGSYVWKRLPEYVALPDFVGIVAVSLDGAVIDNPYRDSDGRLWLAQRSSENAEADELILRVSRKFTDAVPFLMTTRLDLQVAGKAREVVFPQSLLAGFSAYALNSSLPARFDEKNQLRISLRPGHWILEFSARHEGPVNEIALPEFAEPWPADEIWVFDPRPEIRVVDVSGLISLDPRQTDLPEDWKNLSAYQAEAGQKLILSQKRRGHENPEPDRLQLSRSFWLDFDGGGFSYRDNVSGVFKKSWRLDMSPALELGRVTLLGEDQFITRLPESKNAGVEVRQGDVNLTAEGRGQLASFNFPAVAWEHDFDGVSGQLFLPPGWSVLTARGVDKISGTWMGRWTLLDLFLLCIFTLSAAKIWGFRVGALAFFTMLLTLTESDAPRWLWLFVFIWQALVKVLPDGKLFKFVRFLKYATLVPLTLIGVAFALVEIRHGLYPVLGDRDYDVGTYYDTGSYGRSMEGVGMNVASAPPMPHPAKAALDDANAPAEIEQQAESYLSSSLMRKREKQTYAYKQAVSQQVQTGFGLPTWEWNAVTFSWSGSIPADHLFQVYLLSPRINLLFAFIRVMVLILLILKALGIPCSLRGGSARTGIAVCFLLLILNSGSVYAGGALPDVPDSSLLDELRERVLKHPDCFPDCADISRMKLELVEDVLTLRIEIAAEAETAVPLPGHENDWRPAQVVLSGTEETFVTADAEGFLWVKVPKGLNTVVLSGKVTGKNEVRIPFKLKPHHVSVTHEGWDVSGLDREGVPEETLTLNRLAKQKTPAGERVSNLPPLVEIERRVSFGLTWEVETTVRRLSPTGQPIVLKIPLLPEESVLSEGAGDAKGYYKANLGPQTSSLTWNSVLPITESLEFKAPETSAWVEKWILDITPLWHVEFSGIPSVHPGQVSDLRLPVWLPWPGESMKIAIKKPEGIPGATLTIDKAQLHVTPGLRDTDATLNLSVRTSLGGQQKISLRNAEEIQSVTVNGISQPVRREGENLILPLKPGAQEITVVWKEKGGLGMVYQTPEIRLADHVVNASLDVNMPSDRWILWLSGPAMGGVVQYWSLLALIVIISFILGKFPVSFLKPHQWILLFMGLTQTSVFEAGFVAIWLLALGASGIKMSRPRPFLYDLRQIALVLMSLLAFAILVDGIEQGLLGLPAMHIEGYGSYSTLLRWYQDRASDLFPQARVISLPLLAYHFAMLAWGLWMAFSLLSWVKRGWQNMTADGVWQKLPSIVAKK